MKISEATIAPVLLLTLSMVAPISDAALQDDLLDHMVGHWTMSGMIANAKVRQTVDAEWVLNHQFMRFTQKQEGPDGRTLFELIMYIGYDDAKKRICGPLTELFRWWRCPGRFGTTNGQ